MSTRRLPLLSVARWAAPSLAAFLATGTASAQVTEAVVGVTPTCPYGLRACWAGAYAALNGLDGVASVTTVPDNYNCTAEVRLKGSVLPDPDAWARTFRSQVGEAYRFRGVEVTVVGDVSRQGDAWVVRVPGVERPIALAALRNKIQWNFRKEAARQPEPDERVALDQLAGLAGKAGEKPVKVQLTGPLRKDDSGMVLEVREFFDVTPKE